ncbi:MAG: response regulator [Deltaproteobacteria bacterium]|nr:response regulator [Deltaproteobacteria bacterium]
MPNKTILLVEDDPMNMRLAQHILESQGYTVVGATTGQEALNQIKTNLPDLILMDVQLPDIDGMTLVRIIRAKDITRDTTILALTACAMKGDREKILKTGCNDYISKPINVEKFISTVRRYLDTGN